MARVIRPKGSFRRDGGKFTFLAPIRCIEATSPYKESSFPGSLTNSQMHDIKPVHTRACATAYILQGNWQRSPHPSEGFRDDECSNIFELCLFPIARAVLGLEAI